MELPPSGRAWIGFLAMCLGMFMAILDIQIVASSLPAIAQALVLADNQLSWVQTAYLISEIIAIPLTARLTRVFSLGGFFVAAIAGFTLASLGCALSGNFTVLILFRVIQGFCGGAVIPTVFTAVFVLFPPPARVLPTTIAGIFAVLAPTLGPTVGGYITESYSWHWLFLINLLPGLVVAAAVRKLVAVGTRDWPLLRHLDYVGVVLSALFLASLEILLTEAPKREWQGRLVFVLWTILLVSGVATVRRCLSRSQPLVELRAFARYDFVAASVLSFVLGMGLYGSVYMLPLFLGFVREHTPLEIGEIMIVGGVAQLAAAPFAAMLEKRSDPRLLAALGYTLFAAGLLGNAMTTYESDYDVLFWPQVLRGAGVLICILSTTAIALEGRTGDALMSASALFNLMRNLGGAVGIAFVDTILEQRPAAHAARLAAQLQAGSREAARLVGLPPDARLGGPVDDMTRELVTPLVERAALVLSFNEAWLALGVVFVLSLAVLPLIRLPPTER